MSALAGAVVFVGVAVIVLAGIGLLRFRTPYARIHAAGKASPVAFVIVAIGVSIDVGWTATARLALAAAALFVTLPLAVHLLFRAVHAASPELDPPTDEIRRRPDTP